MNPMSLRVVPKQAIAVSDLTIRYGSRIVASICEMTVPMQGVMTILGPSGCGKSSLIKVLSGLADDGMTYDGIILDGIQPRSAIPGSLPYAMMWQVPVVFPCSITENLSIPLRKRKVPKAERRDAIESALSQVGLLDEFGPKWDKLCADDISGGQKQRLCLARGILQNAAVIFLDEPCSALDPSNVDKVETVITQLARNVSIVMVTHNVGQARRLSDQVAIFCVRDGRGVLCEQGEVSRCLYEPNTVEARNFLQFEVGQ